MEGFCNTPSQCMHFLMYEQKEVDNKEIVQLQAKRSTTVEIQFIQSSQFNQLRQIGDI